MNNYEEARKEYGNIVVNEALYLLRINADVWQSCYSYIPEDINEFYPHDWVMSCVCYLLAEGDTYE